MEKLLFRHGPQSCKVFHQRNVLNDFTNILYKGINKPIAAAREIYTIHFANYRDCESVDALPEN